jgi:hypothetical protein
MENKLNKEIIQWGYNYLLSHGYTLRSDSFENVQNTPWSYVIRFITSKGYIYLKHTPHLLALEANILHMLHNQFHASVSEVIAHNVQTLIDTSQNITIIDLGEIVISHPFFSLLNDLQQMKKHHALRDDTNDYLKIRDACLNNYMAFESRENLLNAFKLARPLWFVYGALAGQRLIDACGKQKIMTYQYGKFISSLREFMAVC